MNYFWYSRKQQDACNRFEKHKMLVLAEGEWKLYTEWTHKNIPFGKWDDYILVLQAPDPVHYKSSNGPINATRSRKLF